MTASQSACLLAAVLLSVWLTMGVRRFALSRGVLDHPNERSSHDVPVPRGGGLAIVIVVSLGVAVAGLSKWIPTALTASLLPGGLAVSAIGWLDDRRHVLPRHRFLIHVVAATWAIWCLGGLPTLRVGGSAAHLGFAGSALAVIGIVWATNLYNFMDGIDGIAGAEAVFVGAGGGALLLSLHAGGLGFATLLIAAASAGFLWWNRSPARIFMGDVGSGYCGYYFAVIAVASERAGALPLFAWSLLLGVFIFDATVTLLRRVVAGSRWYSPHRTHAYQRMVRRGWSHSRVVMGVLALDIVLFIMAGVLIDYPSFLGAVLLTALGILALAYLLIERVAPMELQS